MASDLIAGLKINESLPEGKFLFVTKDHKCDIGFVYTDVISYLLKKDYRMIIINCVQSYNHYYHLFSRTGLILKSLVDSSKVVVIDLFKIIEETADVKTFDDQPPGLEKLSRTITKALRDMEKQEGPGFIIFIDEINVLFNLGFSLNSIARIIRGCRISCSRKHEKQGFLLVGAHLEPHDEELSKYLNYLSNVADMRVHVQGLPTGYSKDVHGKIFLQVKDKCLIHSKVYQTELFKVGEKGVKFCSNM